MRSVVRILGFPVLMVAAISATGGLVCTDWRVRIFSVVLVVSLGAAAWLFHLEGIAYRENVQKLKGGVEGHSTPPQ